MTRRRMRLGTVFAIGAMVVGTTVAVGSASAAAPIGCGTVIAKSTVLWNDIGPCPVGSDGLIVGADNITVNLNGHYIKGPGPGPCDQPDFWTGCNGDSTHAGIRVPMRKRVTITSGRPGASIEGFQGAGVFINGGSTNAIQNLYIHDNLGPDTTSALLGDGIAVFNSSGNQLLNNKLVHNGMYDNIAILGPESNNNSIRDNTVSDAPGPVYCNICGYGIVIDAYLDQATGRLVHKNDVIGNTVTNNWAAGISNVNTADATIARNTVNGANNGDGIGFTLGLNPETRDANMQVTDNVLQSLWSFGLTIGSDSNTVSRNTVITSGTVGMAIYGEKNQIDSNKLQFATSVPYYPQMFVAGGANLVQSNTITDSPGPGIWAALCPQWYCGIGGYSGGPTNTFVSNFVVNNLGDPASTYPPRGADLVDQSPFPLPDGRDAPDGGWLCLNQWTANTYVTAYPECTTNGGRQVAAGTQPPPGAATGAPGKAGVLLAQGSPRQAGLTSHARRSR